MDSRKNWICLISKLKQQSLGCFLVSEIRGSYSSSSGEFGNSFWWRKNNFWEACGQEWNSSMILKTGSKPLECLYKDSLVAKNSLFENHRWVPFLPACFSKNIFSSQKAIPELSRTWRITSTYLWHKKACQRPLL